MEGEPVVGLRKTSLVDFPGRLAAVIFLPGCDFRCPYCHNAALVSAGAVAGASGAEVSTGLLPLSAALAHLELRRDRLSGLVISGGEPLLRPDLVAEITVRARELGYAVKLDTNGSRPGALAALLDDPAAAPDYLALDLKTGPSSYARVAPAGAVAGAAVAGSLAAIRASGRPFELRITCAPGIVDLDAMSELADLLREGDEVVLQPFRPGGCLDPAWDALPPPGAAEMAALLAAARRRSPKARIRGEGGPRG